MKVRQPLQSVFSCLGLHLTARTDKPMLVAEQTMLCTGLKSPGKADSARGYAVNILRPENAGGGHSDIGGTVSQSAQRHFPGNFHAGQIERFDSARADMQHALLGLW